MTEYLWQDREKKEYVYPFNPRPECLDMLQRSPTVALDIGCGSGGVGHALRERYPACTLWGCEFNASAARDARQHFDKVVEQDVETIDFGAQGLESPFDLVCLFDVLDHRWNFLGAGRDIFERHRGQAFPFLLSLEGLTIEVKSAEDLTRLCADQNLYLLSPHSDRFHNDAEREMASSGYPHTYAFGG